MADQVRPASSEGESEHPRQAWLLVAAGALAVALWLLGLEWAFTRLYALNFSVRGPNVTLLLAAAVVTAWAGPAARRLGERWRGVAPALPVAGGGLLLASGVLALPAALLASLGALAALTPVLAALVARLRERAALAAALGVALVLLARALLHTVPPYGLPAGWVAIGLAVACLVGCWLALARGPSGRFSTALTRPVAAVYALVFVEVLFLGSTATVAGWTLRPTALVGVASAVGLVSGGAVVATRHFIGRRPATWSAVYLVAVVDLLWLDLVAGASVLPAQTAAVVLVWHVCRQSAGDRAGATAHLAGVQAASVLLVLLYVSAVNAPYMPGPLARLGGLEGVFLLAGLGLLPAVALTARHGPRVAEPAGVPPADARRGFLALAATGSGTVAASVLGPLASAATGTERSPDSEGGPTGDGRTGGAGAPDARAIRATTYNVHRFLGADASARVSLPAIASVLEAADPDLVGLQETDGMRLTTGGFDGVRWLAATLGYHAVDPTPGRLGSYGVAVLSRWPVDDAQLVTLPVGPSPPRLALVASVAAPDGPLRVISTHFETRRPGHRQAAAAALLVDLTTGTDRTVVLGDCNVRPDRSTPAYARLDDALTDAWAAAPGTGPGHTYSPTDPHERIDYVWLHGDWQVRDATVSGTAAASDHLAVTATVVPE